MPMPFQACDFHHCTNSAVTYEVSLPIPCPDAPVSTMPSQRKAPKTHSQNKPNHQNQTLAEQKQKQKQNPFHLN